MARREKERKGKTSAGLEGISRRQFIQTAEVAALSLFGVLGLDAVMEAVEQRLRERRRIDALADRVAEDVRRHGAAYADVHCGET